MDVAGEHTGWPSSAVSLLRDNWPEKHVLYNVRKRKTSAASSPMKTSPKGAEQTDIQQFGLRETWSVALSLRADLVRASSEDTAASSWALLCPASLTWGSVLTLHISVEGCGDQEALACSWRQSAQALYYVRHNICCTIVTLEAERKKGGGGWVITSAFATLGYEYMTLAHVSASCVSAFVGEIWPEVLLERNLATLSNRLSPVRSSFAR